MSGERSSLSAQGEEILQAVRRGMEFTRELLHENERLRHRLALVEDRQQHAAQSPEHWEKLRGELLGRIDGLEQEHQSLRERLREVEAENRDFAGRYRDVEQENDHLANLYVASYQLHSTLDVDEVLRIITEIVINLIGADVFAIYLIDERREELHAVAAQGLSAASLPACRLGEGRLGETVAAGVPRRFEAPQADGPRTPDPDQPLVCIPLRLGEQAIGGIAIFGVLRQKQGFSALDQELFDVLAGHAATAIFAARLHSQSERKLSTIQGFIDLLTR
jgi:nitrate/nitrite-specific signal transduction histidine kinase